MAEISRLNTPPPGDSPVARILASSALRFLIPVLVLAAASAVSLLVLPGLEDTSEARIVAAGLALDFTLVVPALVFFLLVRGKRWPWILLFPTLVAGHALAGATIPAQHQAPLETLRLLLAPAELLLVGYLAALTRTTLVNAPRVDGDFATRFRSTARDVLGTRIPADILTTEVAILYYAFRWRRSSSQSPGSFTAYRELGYFAILMGLIMIVLIETVALHFFVTLWSSTVAWILTGLSIYAAIWLVGDYRAMVARPTRITPTHLSLRLGVRWEAEIPLGQIAGVDLLRPHKEEPGKETLVAALLGQPNVRLRLRRPVQVIGMYGIQKTAGEIWLRVDRAVELCAALHGSGVTGSGVTS